MADLDLIMQLLWFFGGAIVAIILLCILFIPHFRLASLKAPPNAVLDRLSYKLRIAGFRVTEKHREVTVRSGDLTEIKITAEESGDGSFIYYQASMVQTGWAIVLVLIWISIFFTGLLAAAISAGIFLLDLRFARRIVLPLLTIEAVSSPQTRVAEVSATVTGTDDSIKRAIVAGLSEGYRLEEEARDADRSLYHDYLLITCVGSLVLWVLTLVLTAFNLGFPLALAIPSIVALSFGLGVGGLLHLRFSPRLRSYASWANRFREYLRREEQEGHPAPQDASAFELIEEASREVSVWLHRVHRRATQSNPAIEIAIVIMGIWGFNLIAMALFVGSAGDIVLAAVAGFSGFGLFAAAYMMYSHSVISETRKLELELTEWRKRSERLQSQMERYLEEL